MSAEPEPVQTGDVLTVPDYLAEMLAEDADSASELVQLFLEDTASSLNALEAALASDDSKRVSRFLHSIKGSSAQMGALSMSNACAELEHGASNGDLFPTGKSMPEIRKIFSEVNHRLTSILPTRRDA